MALGQLPNSTRHTVSRYIIPNHERSRTGSHYKREQGIDMLCKHSGICKVIKALAEKQLDEKLSSVEDDLRRGEKRKCSTTSSGSTTQPRASRWATKFI